MQLPTRSELVRTLVLLLSLTLSWAVILLPTARASGPAPGQWDQPTAQIAEQIAAILGPGPAQLALNNRSTIPAEELVPIRRALEQALRSRGIQPASSEAANLIRVTLSEDARERLWVAEIVEGNRTQVAMLRFDRPSPPPSPENAGLILEKKRIWASRDLVPGAAPASIGPGTRLLAVLETRSTLILLTDSALVALTRTAGGWTEAKHWDLAPDRNHTRDNSQGLSRDPRGVLSPSADGSGFTAYLPGTRCTGTLVSGSLTGNSSEDWHVQCAASDDPWQIAAPDSFGASAPRAFSNDARNYFTGVLSPSYGVDIAPFYTLAVLPPAASVSPSRDPQAFLIDGIDGKVRRIDATPRPSAGSPGASVNAASANAASVRPVSGTRDWGSDFAAVRSGCGSGTQIIASSSGEAASDSLRAYELPALEAIAVSAPLDMGGAVDALTTDQGGASATAIIRRGDGEYEVDRVTPLCP